jgi:hypothetical protein
LDGQQVTPYYGLSQIIISTALVKPKPGVFVEEIQRLLVRPDHRA